MADARLRRQVAQEGTLREINEALRRGLADLHELPSCVAFVCECSQTRCDASVQLAPAAYDAIRDRDRHFVVAPGHDTPAIEAIIEAHDAYHVVEKLVAAPVAGADPPAGR